MLVYCVVDSELSPTFQLGTSLETFLRREDAERFIEDVRGDDEKLARSLHIVEREPRRAGGTDRTWFAELA